jgi:AhpD family alkylhydroperoxidase
MAAKIFLKMSKSAQLARRRDEAANPSRLINIKNQTAMKTSTTSLQPRMPNPAMILTETMALIQALYAATYKGGVPPQTLALVHLRASQINGCSSCVDAGARSARKAGETDDRLFAVSAWRDTPYFTDAERAALALTEAVTRLSDRADPVPDEVWDDASQHYDETGLATLLLSIGITNLFNRFNVPTRQIAGDAAWSGR